jgi:4-amino-4-deoxy-L-arabinose transferase-like glycosyltransferase
LRYTDSKLKHPRKTLAIQSLSNNLNPETRVYRRTGRLARALRLFESPTAFLAASVLIAFFLRLIVVFFVVHNSGHTINDTNFGWESWEMGWTARSIFLGHGFSSPFLPITGPTALVPPLYPYLIAAAFRMFGLYTSASAFAVLGFNSLCSALTCIPLYFLVRNSLTKRAARIASFAWAVYPFAIYFSADRVWDYALTGLLFTCCLLVAQTLTLRGPLGWGGFGLLYGAAVLSNPSIVTLLPLFLLIAAYPLARARQPWVAKTLFALAAFVLVCTPWTIRNERVMHANFFIRDGFPLELYAGNNGDTVASNSAFAHPASNPAEMTKYQNMGEIAYMAEKRDLAINFISHHPGFFAVATLRRILRFWTGYWSLSPSYLKFEPFDLPNVPFCLFLMFFMVKGILRWRHHHRSAVLPYLLALLVFPLPYYITHSSMDYRQPIEPIIVILVSIGLFRISTKPISPNPALHDSIALQDALEDQTQPEAVLV